MKKPKKKLLYHTVNILTIAMIIECFLCTMLVVQKYARESCYDRIEETATQISSMFTHAMEERRDKLTVFADILAANTENPEDLLKTHMENFCRTQYFAAVCIHRANGTTISYGAHPHHDLDRFSFDEEVSMLPYVSDVFFYGTIPEENYVYQAVPIIRNNQTVAILYGYISLDILPELVASSSYDGQCKFYIVDGQTGHFLMDEHHESLGNIFSSTEHREVKPGFSLDQMLADIQSGIPGFFAFRSQLSGMWTYMYYTPLGINHWTLQLTIDEPTAFMAYNQIHSAMVVLMCLVLVFLVALVLSLMTESKRVKKQDNIRLKQTSFVNTVQQSLLNSYTHSDSIYQALKTVAQEIQAETVLLLSFTDNVVTNAQYWPSTDKAQALDMMGRNIRDHFPVLYDLLSSGKTVIYDKNNPQWSLSQTAEHVFLKSDVTRIILVPILDTVFGLKGAIAAVNTPQNATAELLESVVYDFFMAITNLENHNIIKKMGTTDYLTGMKNRNSFESDLRSFATAPGETLWCAYVDVNGLHQINNLQGHRAGDRMLCAVASEIHHIFGSEFAYRLGGDEFVVFQADSTHDLFMNYKYRLLDNLAKQGYSVSIGFEGCRRNQNGVFDVDKLLQDAEKIMYQNKWEYYKRNDLSTERGHFPALQDMQS